MKLKKGAQMMARWQNSLFYYQSTLVEEVGEDWKVRYNDGSEGIVKKDDLHSSVPAHARNRSLKLSSPTRRRRRQEVAMNSPARKITKFSTEGENNTVNSSASTENNAMSEHPPESAELDGKVPDVQVVNDGGVASSSAQPYLFTEQVDNPQMTRETFDLTGAKESYSGSGVGRLLMRGGSSDLTGPKESDSGSGVGRLLMKWGSADLTGPKESYSGSGDGRLLMRGGSADMKSHEELYQGAEVRRPLREGSVESRGSAECHPSIFRRSVSVTKESEPVANDMARRRDVYQGAVVRRPLREGSLDSRASAEYHPSHSRRSVSMTNENEPMANDMARRRDLYQGAVARRPLREGSLDSRGSAEYRSSDSRRSVSMTKENEPMANDMARRRDLYQGAVARRPLREGSLELRRSADDHPSPFRPSVGGTRENELVASGSSLSRYAPGDYKKKYFEKYPMEFGGRYGTFLLILLLPLYIMSVTVLNLVPDFTKFEVLFEEQLPLILPVAAGIVTFLFIQAVFSIVPIGTVARGPLTKLGILEMRCNGIFSALFTLIVIASLFYCQRGVIDLLVDVYTEAAFTAMILGVIFSLVLYRKGGKVPVYYLNPYGCTGFMWYDFWMGREITPHFGKFNVKVVLQRFSVIGMITLNVLFATKGYWQGLEKDILKPLLLSAGLQSLYCAHILLHEDIYLYSFLAVSEGVGYMITVGFMTYPFIWSFTTKAILDYRVKASFTELLITLCTYMVGHIFLEVSNNRKTLSVRDSTTSLWRMKVLPKWSPGVKYGAYVGEVLIYWSLAILAGTTHHGIFFIPATFTLGALSKALREYTRSAAYPVA